MRFYSVFAIIMAGFFILGCSGVTYDREYSKPNGLRPGTAKETMINYSLLTDQAINQIFKKSDVPEKLIVTDFVDLTSLENHSRLGYVLSNNIKNSLINIHNATVIEAEVSKYFKISGNGLKILSRDINHLKSKNFDVTQAVVGTYTYTDTELILFVKLINLETGVIEGSYAKSLLIGPSTKMMLKD